MVRGDTLNERLERTLKISRKIWSANYTLIEIWECTFDEQLRNHSEMRLFIEQNENVWKMKTLVAREALFGGRTGTAVLAKEVHDENEKIKYVDVGSLYPCVCKNCTFPIGHPKVLIGKECSDLVGPTNDLTRVNGVVACTILPPRNMYHPVLPVRIHKKLLFPLCHTCAMKKRLLRYNHENEDDRCLVGTWASVELKESIRYDYKIKEIYEIWQSEMTQYDRSTGQGGLIAGYIDEFFKQKTLACGYPPECNDEISRDEYIRTFKQSEGIKLDENFIRENLGLRSVAKACLNSL